jgi:hypothetical protein
MRTGGKYHDKIEKAGGKALGYVGSLGDGERDAPAGEEPPPAA